MCMETRYLVWTQTSGTINSRLDYLGVLCNIFPHWARVRRIEASVSVCVIDQHCVRGGIGAQFFFGLNQDISQASWGINEMVQSAPAILRIAEAPTSIHLLRLAAS